MTNEKRKYAETFFEKWNRKVNKLFSGAPPKDRLLTLAANAASGMCAFILSVGAFPFVGSAVGSPLTDAFICASGRYTPGAFAGAIYGTYITGGSVQNYIALTAVMLIRFIGCHWLCSEKNGCATFTEPANMRLAACAILVLLHTCMRLTSGSYSNEMWRSLAITLISAPLLCGFSLFYFSGYPVQKGLRRALYYISMTGVFSVLVYCASGVRYAGCSVGVVLAVFLTLATARYGGFLAGGIMGLILGLLTSPANTVPTALIGLCGGIFFSVGVATSAGISAIVGAISTFALNGMSAALSFIPETVLSIAITSPVLKYDFLPADFPFPHSFNGSGAIARSLKYSQALRSENSYGTLMRLSDAFSELSDTFSEPKSTLSASVTDSVRENFCEKCPMSPICWENEKGTASAAISQLTELYLSGTDDVRRNIPLWLSEHCVRLRELCTEIQKLSECARSEHLPVSPDPLLDGLRDISEMLTDLASDVRSENTPDEKTGRAVLRAASALGYRPEAVAVLGESRKRVYAYGLGRVRSNEDAEKLRKAFSEICGEQLAPPDLSGEERCVVFSPALKLRAETSYVGSVKDGEPCSGDRAFSFTTDDGCFYSVITDGMGSGREAAECSSYASETLEKLLRCNVKKSLAVRMLGSMLRRRFSECFSTVDIMKLDLVSGQTGFLKSGAAASYVVRSGSVYCVNSCTMPVGITGDALPEEMCLDLREGDTVIMMSDGVASDPSDGAWLTNALTSGALETPEKLANDLLSRAVKLRGKVDDMTVSVISILSASESA